MWSSTDCWRCEGASPSTLSDIIPNKGGVGNWQDQSSLFSLDTVAILPIWNELVSKFEPSTGLLSTMVHSSQQFSFFYLYEKITYPLTVGTSFAQSDKGELIFNTSHFTWLWLKLDNHDSEFPYKRKKQVLPTVDNTTCYMMAGNTREYQIHVRNLCKTQRSTVGSRQKKKTRHEIKTFTFRVRV